MDAGAFNNAQTRILSAAAVINVLVAYLSAIVPWAGSSTGRAIAMMAGVGIATAVNVRGVRQAAWSVNAFTVAGFFVLPSVTSYCSPIL